MYREAIEKLYEWKERINHKPLIIRGARQVGKTWLMKEFGSKAFSQVAYINFDSNSIMSQLFSSDLDTKRLINGIEIYTGIKINPADTLIIFDEIQEVPKALSSLKYFNENAPEYYIICAGSLLGIALHSGTSFPVGKVEFLDLCPLSFNEYLLANHKDNFVNLLKKQDYEMITNFKDYYIDELRKYYYIGGMPEVVEAYSLRHDFNEVREIQKRILIAYEQDFSKHAPNQEVPRIRTIWNSIPQELAKENKKFLYGLLKEGARAKEYETALMWLSDCGLVYKVYRVNTPNIPLSAYEDNKAFKLFFLDVGLLSSMASLSQYALLNGNEIFKEFKGALTEQYVLEQLKSNRDLPIYYYSNEKSTAEIDFLINYGDLVVPIEVKAETNLMAKSLKVYNEKYHPKVSIRLSMSNYKKEEWLINLPLYAISNITKEINDWAI